MEQVAGEQSPSKPDVLELLTKMYEGLSEQEIDDIECIALDRRDFFSRSIADLHLEEWPK
ncbi:MAG: hypothetical protein AAB401_17140 [Acidobacteriota bacterium]